MRTFHALHEESPGRWTLEFFEPVFDLLTFDTFLEDFKNFLLMRKSSGKKERLELIVDLTNLKVLPDITYIQKLVVVMGVTNSLGVECCGTTTIVAPCAALRAFISAVCTLQPPSTPVKVVGSRPVSPVCLTAPAVTILQ